MFLLQTDMVSVINPVTSGEHAFPQESSPVEQNAALKSIPNQHHSSSAGSGTRKSIVTTPTIG
jgi:hypothetical protein